MPALDTSNFIVKPLDVTPLERAAAYKERADERQYERNYRLQKDKEAQDWRNAGILKDIDFSKSSGVPTIDEAYGKALQNQYNDLVKIAGTGISPIELMGEVVKKTTPIYRGWDMAKVDYANGMNKVNSLMKEIPQLDKNRLVDKIRMNTIGNYLNPDLSHKDIDKLTETDNSEFDDINNLTQYATGTDALSKSFAADKGRKMEYTTHIPGGTRTLSTVVPGYISPSVTQDELVKNNLFVPQGRQMNFPVTGKNGLMNPEIAANYVNDAATQVALNKALQDEAKSKGEDLSKLNATELQNRKLKFLYDYAGKIPLTTTEEGVHYVPKYMTTVNTGSKSDEVNVNDIYKGIDESLTEQEGKGVNWLPVSILKPDAKEVVMKAANIEDKDLKPDELQIIRGDDGSLRVFKKDGDFVNYIPRVATNIGKQANVAGKKEVIKRGEAGKVAKFPLPAGKPRTVTQGGYTYTWDEKTGEYK